MLDKIWKIRIETGVVNFPKGLGEEEGSESYVSNNMRGTFPKIERASNNFTTAGKRGELPWGEWKRVGEEFVGT